MSQAINSFDSIHQRNIDWAESQGVEIYGVEAVQMPNKGLGVIAKTHIKKDDLLIFIPRSALLFVNPTDKISNPAYETCSIHARLAGKLQDAGSLDAWKAAMPSVQDLKQSIPLMWPKELQERLPYAAKYILKKQRVKFNSDLNSVTSPAQSQAERELYERYWLLVNTRCFYWDYPELRGTKRKAGKSRPKPQRKLDRNDCLVLCPFADYFNHADEEGCIATYNEYGYSFRSLRDHEPGEELLINYGKYSNDYLLAEYGFILDNNPSDHIRLDEWIMPRLSEAQKERLDSANLLGTYILDYQETCHRTQAALRIMLVSSSDWDDFVSTGQDLAPNVQQKVDRLCLEVLREARKSGQLLITDLQNMADGYSRNVLLKRWQQIMSFVNEAIDKL